MIGTISKERERRVTSGALLLWALFHAPLFAVFFDPQIASTLAQMPPAPRTAMACCLCVEALFLSVLLFVGLSPARALGRAGRYVIALGTAISTAFLLIDAHLHHVLGIHINRLILQVIFEPHVLAETGISIGELSIFLGRLTALATVDFLFGIYFLSRSIHVRPFRIFAVTGAILLLEVADRAAVATLEAAGGDYFQAAGHVFPLQPPLRLKRFLSTYVSDQLDQAPLLKRLNEQPVDVHLTRKPDIVLVLVESLRYDFVNPLTMPRLHQRSLRGAVFDKHYASASSTHYSLFSLLFGMHPHRLEEVVGRGESPLIFRALRANGYQFKVLTASSVNWLKLKQTVFRDVAANLETDFDGDGFQKDSHMIEAATQFVQKAEKSDPFFLLVFFDGTHFPYSYPSEGEIFRPCWNGMGASELSERDSPAVANRARNAAHEVDRKLNEFLEGLSRARNRELFVVVTGDHGESLGEHGRFGHGSGVTSEQLHVPMLIWDSHINPGRRALITSHVDVVPTILAALGETADPTTYSDGIVMDHSVPGRFALVTAGWEAQTALIGEDLKVAFRNDDLGFSPLRISDPQDRPLPEAAALLKLRLAGIWSALQPAVRHAD